MKITTDRYIPNTPFTVYFDNKWFTSCILPIDSLECYVEIKMSSIFNPSGTTIPPDYSDWMKKSIKLDVYYGDFDNNFGKQF